MNEGLVCWFTGLSGSGKSTIARLTERILVEEGMRVEVLDGDEVRLALNPELGYTYDDRMRHVKRTVYVAGLLAKHDVTVLVPFITPYREMRAYARAMLSQYREIYVECPFAECARRDVKGLYRKALEGQIAHFTGLSDAYDIPVSPDLVIPTLEMSPKQSADRLVAAIRKWIR
ncbi:adenylyl-sulfate kinase [Cohnella sp. AR92]|uniref:adenylyl-sulfate kinase n=1 Tax=Cohnella sp. AR92 TaxID=648716 RepID=UPI000F8C4A96|nr:adenylyl-sulfate kinase [Cohnella sp. AR92]RUS47138.1 adenylyl-sulfate kinase [Cohnella sp. AR92]